LRESRRRFHLSAAKSAMLTLGLGFALLIIIGTGLLMLPQATVAYGSAPLVTALFTSASATCVTGLVVVDSATYWTGFGQMVIVALMFMGGLGIMTSGAVLLIAIGRRVTLNDRLVLRESFGSSNIGGVTQIIKHVLVFAVLSQLIGYAVLLWRLYGDLQGDTPWQALFLSVSAFNNAGFNILPNSESLINYSSDVWIISSVGLLIILGSTSLPVFIDLWKNRRISRFSLDTKLVLLGFFGAWALGLFSMLAFEWGNSGTLGSMSGIDKISNAAFQSITSRTAGFSTIGFEATKPATDSIFMLLMLIGGASGSTAGGIKINTVMVLAIAGYASVRGRPRAEAFKREIPYAQIARALAVVFLAVIVLFGIVLGLAYTEDGNIQAGNFSFLDLLFEAISAFGTSGLSRGITSELSQPGQILLAFAMYLGRLGPLTIAAGLALKERRAVYRFASERVRIG